MKASLLCLPFLVAGIIAAPLRPDVTPYSITDQLFVGKNRLKSGLTCDICEGVVSVLQQLIDGKAAEEDIVKIAISICIDLKIQDKNVCESIVPLFKVHRLNAQSRIYIYTNLFAD